MTKKAYNIAEFAAMYSLNEQTVRVNVTRRPKTLPVPMRVGNRVLFTATAIKNWEVAMQQ
jgi:hypothetical protein